MAQTYVIQSNVTDANGKIVATATTQFTVSESVAPTTNPAAATPPASAGVKPAWLTSLPGIAGEIYSSTQWLSSLPWDANGHLNLTPLIPANAVRVCLPTMAGYKAGDYPDLNSALGAAVANGSLCIEFVRGDIYSASMMDQNIQGATGTAIRPFIVTSVGPNGFSDYSLPDPILQDGFGVAGSPANGKSYGGPMHYLIIDGLNFQAPAGTTPSSSWAVRIADTANGAPSDHLGIFDCAVTGYQGGFDLENDCTDSGDCFSTFIVDHCVVYNNHGGPTQPGLYCCRICDLLVSNSVFAGNGTKNNMGTAHDIYVNPDHPMPGDPSDTQNRFVGDVFATAAAFGCESNYGGFFDHCLSLANPIAFYGGGGQPVTIQNCVVDGGGGEFDGSSPGSTLNLATTGATATGRGWGAYSDCATTANINNLICINKNDAADVQYNGGFGVGVHCTDNGKNPEGMPTEATAATVGPNVIVHNWFDSSGSNAINLSQTTPPLPTITYSGVVVLPGVNGVTGVTGVEPAYVDNTRSCSMYAKTLAISGVTDGPSLLTAMEGNSAGNWDDRLTAASLVNWIQAGFQVKQ